MLLVLNLLHLGSKFWGFSKGARADLRALPLVLVEAFHFVKGDLETVSWHRFKMYFCLYIYILNLYHYVRSAQGLFWSDAGVFIA